MPKTTARRRRRIIFWSSGDVAKLKRHAGRKHARTIGNLLSRRRQEGAVRQKARKLGVSLDTRG